MGTPYPPSVSAGPVAAKPSYGGPESTRGHYELDHEPKAPVKISGELELPVTPPPDKPAPPSKIDTSDLP